MVSWRCCTAHRLSACLPSPGSRLLELRDRPERASARAGCTCMYFHLHPAMDPCFFEPCRSASTAARSRWPDLSQMNKQGTHFDLIIAAAAQNSRIHPLCSAKCSKCWRDSCDTSLAAGVFEASYFYSCARACQRWRAKIRNATVLETQ